MRRVDVLLDNYSADHQNPTNQLIHVLCVPAIAWSVSAMLWAIPVPNGPFRMDHLAALTIGVGWTVALIKSYSADRGNPANRLIRVMWAPVIVGLVLAVLWATPVPSVQVQAGGWAVGAMFLAWMAYWDLSRKLALGMLVAFVATAFLNRWIADTWGVMMVLWLGIGVFVVAWIAQFIGHHIEGKRPSFLTDMVYLLVGPMWTLRKLYTRLGWGT